MFLLVSLKSKSHWFASSLHLCALSVAKKIWKYIFVSAINCSIYVCINTSSTWKENLSRCSLYVMPEINFRFIIAAICRTVVKIPWLFFFFYRLDFSISDNRVSLSWDALVCSCSRLNIVSNMSWILSLLHDRNCCLFSFLWRKREKEKKGQCRPIRGKENSRRSAHLLSLAHRNMPHCIRVPCLKKKRKKKIKMGGWHNREICSHWHS